MTDKELRKLSRSELLELMLAQSQEIDRLQAELQETKDALQERNIKIENCGSIAEAATEVNSLFRAAQRAADMYLINVQRICAEKAEEAGKTEEWERTLRKMEPLPAAAPAEIAQPEETESKTGSGTTEENTVE